jgi:hypothetical protein
MSRRDNVLNSADWPLAGQMKGILREMLDLTRQRGLKYPDEFLIRFFLITIRINEQDEF